MYSMDEENIQKLKNIKSKITNSNNLNHLPSNDDKNMVNENPRLKEICEAYNLSRTDVLKLMNDEFLREFTIDTKLFEKEYNRLKQHFKLDGHNDKFEINSSKLKIHKNSIFKINEFKEIRTIVLYENEPSIESYFTDEQAIVLCGKMVNSQARILAKNVRKNKGDREKYILHYFANKALKIYGGDVITFIINLKQIKIGISYDDKKVYQLDLLKQNEELPIFPSLRIQSPTDSYLLYFVLKKKLGSERYISEISIFSKKTKRVIGTISRRNDAMCLVNNFDIEFYIFLEMCTNVNNVKYYSGIESGRCILCNRVLTDPLSLICGVGPICRKWHREFDQLEEYLNKHEK